MKYIGLSVSLCIKDIAQGTIPQQDVAFIIPGFDTTKTTKEEIFNNYKDLYWKDHKEKAWEILNTIQLYPHVQKPNISAGHWIKCEDYYPDMDLQQNEELKYHTTTLQQINTTPMIPLFDAIHQGTTFTCYVNHPTPQKHTYKYHPQHKLMKLDPQDNTYKPCYYHELKNITHVTPINTSTLPPELNTNKIREIVDQLDQEIDTELLDDCMTEYYEELRESIITEFELNEEQQKELDNRLGWRWELLPQQ